MERASSGISPLLIKCVHSCQEKEKTSRTTSSVRWDSLFLHSLLDIWLCKHQHHVSCRFYNEKRSVRISVANRWSIAHGGERGCSSKSAHDWFLFLLWKNTRVQRHLGSHLQPMWKGTHMETTHFLQTRDKTKWCSRDCAWEGRRERAVPGEVVCWNISFPVLWLGRKRKQKPDRRRKPSFLELTCLSALQCRIMLVIWGKKQRLGHVTFAGVFGWVGGLSRALCPLLVP